MKDVVCRLFSGCLGFPFNVDITLTACFLMYKMGVILIGLFVGQVAVTGCCRCLILTDYY